MSQFSSSSSMQPLSVGNVVTAGIRIYRSHLKDYFLLALKAYVWLLVPVYGWAKFAALSALLARLAFGELVNQPESIDSGTRHVNSKMWQFLAAGLLLFLIGLGIIIGFGIAVGIITAIFAALAAARNTVLTVVGFLVFLVAFFAALLGMMWLFTRFYVFDLPLAVEDNINANSTIKRSWELTKGYVWRILGISFVAWLITLPFSIAVQIVSSIIQVIHTVLLRESSPVFTVIYFIVIMALSFASGAAILPFWQAVKAVVYYDLRTRQEGLGLKLRDRDV
jgi:hypothetical protein